jgi:RHS repeat-associated protein
MQNSAVNPQITYDNAYTYPAPGSAHPHSPTAIGEFNLTTDANGNQITTRDTGTGDVNQYLFDEENRLSCANKGPQMPSPSCIGTNLVDFIYEHAGARKIKAAASPTIYPNQYYTDFGGGSGNQFKHIFIGSERILTKKSRVAPDRQHWYYHPDHLGSTAMVTNENSQLVDAIHYFPFGEVWLEERPSSLPADYFFTAKEFDSETGFYNFGVRYLDPRFSKWMTADPALGGYLSTRGVDKSAGIYTPPNLALYGYGWNNPARFNDPNGSLPDEPNNQSSPSTYHTLGSWPALSRQILGANNIRPKQIEDAAIAGILLDAGSSPGSTFLGLIGEAMFADRMTRDTRDPRFGGIISQSMVVTTPPLPGELLRNVVGNEIPDLYLVQGHLSDQRIVWVDVIGRETGGRIGDVRMNEFGSAGVVLSMIEVTTSTNSERILERGEKVARWAAGARTLGLPIKAALAIDRGAYFQLTPVEQQRLVNTVTSAGGYIFTLREFTSDARENARRFERPLREQR